MYNLAIRRRENLWQELKGVQDYPAPHLPAGDEDVEAVPGRHKKITVHNDNMNKRCLMLQRAEEHVVTCSVFLV